MVHRRYVDRLLRSLSAPANRFDLPKLAGILSSATDRVPASLGAPLDHLYSRLGSFNGMFFEGGWGDLGIVNYEEDLKHLQDLGPSFMKVRSGRGHCALARADDRPSSAGAPETFKRCCNPDHRRSNGGRWRPASGRASSTCCTKGRSGVGWFRLLG